MHKYNKYFEKDGLDDSGDATTSPDMRTKYEKNQDFPLAMISGKSSKILESLRENY